jgi:long-subunit acyl-CoA synthetase (AMP-forming)
MDDVAEAIGALRGTVVALSQRLDALQVERQHQHTEALRVLTDSQAQLHEVKHSLAGTSTKFDAIDYKIVTHQADDKKDHETVIERLDRHQHFADAGIADLRREIVANRDAAMQREATMMARLDDLFAWRSWMRGIGAVVVAALALFGHDILELGKSLLHIGGGK